MFTDVLIVGAGPVGSVLALELARHDVASMVVERSAAAPLFPKMDYLNGRTMELLRRLGLAERVRDRCVDPALPGNFVWTTGPADEPISVWYGPSPAAKAARARAVNDGSAPLESHQRIPGNVLEETLREAVRAHPLVDLREGLTCTGVDEDTVLLADESGARHAVRARYVVGCDGAGSVVRRAAGIDMPAAAPTTQRCSIYFRSADPRLRAHGRAFVTSTTTGVTLVSRDERDLWTASFQVDTEASEVDDPAGVLAGKLGFALEVDEVLCVSGWQGALAVADRYRAGPVFLAGDAAHRYYPFGGHGANTGIADAVDLGWKLAARLRGWGGESLVDSYEAERRPVAVFNREMCANLLEVARRFAALAAAGASRAQLAGFLGEESGQIANTGIHFGYRYARSPVVAHEDGPEPAWRMHEIVPTTWPGGRAPSVRLADGTSLFDRLGPAFTLVDFAGAGEVAAKEAVRHGVPVTYLPVDDPAARAVWERDLVLVRPDQHVAWRGDAVPDDWLGVVDLVSGRDPR